MASQLMINSSPHVVSSDSTAKIMQRVLIALAPAGIFSVCVFGLDSAVLIIACALFCPLLELLWQKLTHQNVTIGDFSAVVTGVLLAYNLPPQLPVWMALVGCIFAIIIVKQLFGGIGQNFVNPAIAGRVFLLISFAGPMTKWLIPTGDIGNIELISGATPLASSGEMVLGKAVDYLPLFLGFKGGSIGEVSAVLLLLGGIFLIATKVISPLIPAVYMGTVTVLTLIAGYDPLFHLLTGGLILGAVFMATDYVTSPVTVKGKIIFAIGCGVITFLVRIYGSFPEGVSFAILLMNIATPLIDRFTPLKAFGALAPEKKGGES